MMLALVLVFLQAADTDAAQVAERINLSRRLAGLEPVSVDPFLSRGCAAHAEYLLRNVGDPSTQGLGLHQESAHLPGYSKEGERAAKASVIFLGLDGPSAVDGWMGSLFHRIPLLQSRLRKIGYSMVRGGPAQVTTVLDATNGMGVGKDAPVVLYPADTQKDVPLAFSSEIPDPIPESSDKKAGYPVTAIFAEGALVKDVKASLRDGEGKDVSFWLSTPEKPAAADYQRNTVGLIPKAPLSPATAYTVTLSARVTGKPWLRTWTFSTAAR